MSRSALSIVACALVAAGVPAGGTDVIESKVANFTIEEVATGLQIPWAIAFLPDQRMLVSERHAGRLSIVEPSDGSVTPLAGGPTDVFIKDNAGMLDVVLHPDFARNSLIYYAYTAGTDSLNTTVVERARLDGHHLVDRQRIFTALPWYHNSIVYGCRLAFLDGYLFITMGDRWDLRHLSQSPGTHLGKIMRVHDDGSVPADNPYNQITGAAHEVWAIGVRNPQGLAVQPGTGMLWEHEHGPLGGDEVNVIKPGRNYGWPVISHGREYSDEPIGEGITAKQGMEQPAHYYVPSIAPSDMTFYTGSAFPGWQGDLFIGALALTHLNRLVVDGETIVHEERLLEDKAWRIRTVAQGPDELIYIGVDDGLLLRLRPAGEKASTFVEDSATTTNPSNVTDR